MPQILINREPLPHLHFDIELLGDCDVIINELSQRLGGKYAELCNSSLKLTQITERPPRPNKVLSNMPDAQSKALGAGHGLISQDGLAHPELPLTPPLEDCLSSESDSELSQSCKGKITVGSIDDREVCTPSEPSEPVSETPTSNGDEPERCDNESSIDQSRTSLSKMAKEQISKRLDGKYTCSVDHYSSGKEVIPLEIHF